MFHQDIAPMMKISTIKAVLHSFGQIDTSWRYTRTKTLTSDRLYPPTYAKGKLRKKRGAEGGGVHVKKTDVNKLHIRTHSSLITIKGLYNGSAAPQPAIGSPCWIKLPKRKGYPDKWLKMLKSAIFYIEECKKRKETSKRPNHGAGWSRKVGFLSESLHNGNSDEQKVIILIACVERNGLSLTYSNIPWTMETRPIA